MSQVKSRENTFKVVLSNFPKRPSIEDLQKFVQVNLGLAVEQVQRLQINHAQNCAHVKCSDLKTAQDTVANHDSKHVIEINKSKVKVRLVMEDGGVEVKIHDLSENVTNEEIVAFLRHYGDVLSIREIYWGDDFAFHGVSSGIRVAKMVLRRHIKSFVTIQSEHTLVSYRGQPQTCRHCTMDQHIGFSCVENKKLLSQKADLSARLKKAQAAPKSYASVLTKSTVNTDTMIPVFNGTLLGSVIPMRSTTIATGRTVPNSSPSDITKIASTSTCSSSSPSDVSTIVTEHSVGNPSGGGTMHVAEHSVGLQSSGGSTSSKHTREAAVDVTELSAVSTEVGSGGGSSTHESGRSVWTTAVASGDGMLSSPLSPTKPISGDGINEADAAEVMEIENTLSGEDAGDLSTQQQQRSSSSSTQQQQPNDENDDEEMPSLSAATSSALVNTFLAPLPVPDLKKSRSMESISGTESDRSERSGFTTVMRPKRGRPKKAKVDS